ncbi:MAG: undecaprenyl-diphosphatase UppP [Desulfobacterales bacterium]|nr:undecaprenyl-diphosphatase UppP [Desulfobacterales bacterium]MDD4072878.1 undecaprenyl-diphosphatase UppP [Desulfobacterales bacterium]MDD4392323.1 undecaprenyl-diphosphatase UppP [Desulfobacterales bacterium]
MEPIQACILGCIQGLTEFLPISSSGHLVLFQHLFGMQEPQLFFDISVHVGTLIAVMAFFRDDILSILKAVSRLLTGRAGQSSHHPDSPHIRLVMLILIGSIPTAILGLLFHRIADQIFSSVLIVGIMLMITGALLWSSRWIGKETKTIRTFSIKDALTIGLVQGIAILPGISRSGSTIVAGLFRGLDRELAARYSFLLSIPAIAGAELLSLKDIPLHISTFDLPIIIGTITAGITGYCSLKLLLYLIRKGNLHLFAPYCWLIGIIAIIYGR